eukprot:127517_1
MKKAKTMYEKAKDNPVITAGIGVSSLLLLAYGYKKLSFGLSVHQEAEFKIEYQPKDCKNIEIMFVFVHGLGGSTDNTWTNKESGESLPNLVSLYFPNSKIINYGYPNSPIKGNKNPMQLKKRSNNFITGLVEHIEHNDIPIVFITHSMGGLIVKQSLYQISNKSATTSDLYQIYERTKCVVFYATPHRGSYKANILQIIPLLSLFLTTAINDLKVNGQELLHLNRNFNSIVTKHPKYKNISILSLIEEQSQMGGTNIVDNFSATLSLGNHTEKRIPLDYNHTDICKPKDDKDRRFTDLKQFLLNSLNCKQIDDEKEILFSENKHITIRKNPMKLHVRSNHYISNNDYEKQLKQRQEVSDLVMVAGLAGVFLGLVGVSLGVVWAVPRLNPKR